MSNKQTKKLRKYVRQHEDKIISHCWDDFFETMTKLKFKYRLKMALMILTKKNVRQIERNKANGSEHTGTK